MEITVLESKKDCLEFVIKGERHTFTGLLREALVQDPKVEFAAYTLNHPMDKDAKFIVRTDGKTAVKALQDALKAIDSSLGEFEEAVKKALKE
ncbi:MAG: DNA-directed RNA polymerase subunit L [Candidatus ainarchaeum sp.]|nr:DNA-directed RNA polymerase subunit L [Candidatus ainarchaeum sp.]